jgi:hypothetical protein
MANVKAIPNPETEQEAKNRERYSDLAERLAAAAGYSIAIQWRVE